MRQIILDTETTGLEPLQGHRIIELGCVEIVNRRFTQSNFHRYLNPERDSDSGALQIHGLTREFLQDKPKFADIVDEFLEYIREAELIIHNASFDVAFLNTELALLGRGPINECCAAITDTLRMAKDLHPGKRNSLDALCERYQISNAKRILHGALLDAELLGEAFLAMTRGQESLIIDVLPVESFNRVGTARLPRQLIVLPASNDELAAHLGQLAKIDTASNGSCLWLVLDQPFKSAPARALALG
ncbi:MAG: DNA polymerase III subunit epsilon [Burkholderiales bacterium]|nr:DNA polymerase III subunit epsilon [Burkholderiales bacterium]